MGRPKEHDDATGEALLDAAERIVERDGVAALSVRRVAEQAGTTTRAVYTVFGSKEGLIVALGQRAFDWLGAAIDALPASDDPAADLADAGVLVFRHLVVDHPTLFKIGIQHHEVPPELVQQFRANASNALERLHTLFERLRDRGLLDERSVSDAALEFHALCEGLAAIELRGIIRTGREEQIWRDALTALISGFAARSSAAAPRSGGVPSTAKRSAWDDRTGEALVAVRRPRRAGGVR